MMKGEQRARLLAAEAEDRFLITIERPQRFATQFFGPGKLRPVDEGPTSVTDQLRKEMGVSSLAWSRQEEERFADKALPLSARIEKDEKRLTSDSDNVRLLIRLSNEYYEAKQLGKAEAVLLKAIEIEPLREDNYYDLACLYALQGKKRESLSALKQAFKNGFTNWERMQRDSDLDSIRSERDYEKLLHQHKN